MKKLLDKILTNGSGIVFKKNLLTGEDCPWFIYAIRDARHYMMFPLDAKGFMMFVWDLDPMIFREEVETALACVESEELRKLEYWRKKELKEEVRLRKSVNTDIESVVADLHSKYEEAYDVVNTRLDLIKANYAEWINGTYKKRESADLLEYVLDEQYLDGREI